MCMAFPFLMLEDIDEVWEEIKDSRPDLNDLNSKKLYEFVEYFENTWLMRNVILIERIGIFGTVILLGPLELITLVKHII